jgi:acetolactate synthase I/II/III large subunit
LLDGDITLAGLAAVVGAVLPENAIVIDESVTSGRDMMAATKGASLHDWRGQPPRLDWVAMPLAAGAAVACPDRRVVCLTADDTGMYTLQALWTLGREASRSRPRFSRTVIMQSSIGSFLIWE